VNGDAVVELANEGIDEVQTFLASYALSSNVEKLTFIDATSHTGTGNNLANTFTGAAGDDIFTGAAATTSTTIARRATGSTGSMISTPTMPMRRSTTSSI
jgi:hypothetical protein